MIPVTGVRGCRRVRLSRTRPNTHKTSGRARFTRPRPNDNKKMTMRITALVLALAAGASAELRVPSAPTDAVLEVVGGKSVEASWNQPLTAVPKSNFSVPLCAS